MAVRAIVSPTPTLLFVTGITTPLRVNRPRTWRYGDFCENAILPTTGNLVFETPLGSRTLTVLHLGKGGIFETPGSHAFFASGRGLFEGSKDQT